MSPRSPTYPIPPPDWSPRPTEPPRSIFSNYQHREPADTQPLAPKADPGRPAPPLQTAIDIALARSFVYRFLAQAYQDPTEEGWRELTSASCLHDLEAAVHAMAVNAPSLAESVARLCGQLQSEFFDSFLTAYLAAFGHAARGRCPLNEIEYGDIKADPLFQPHRLADIAAFYRAFGLEVAEDADERPDHICLELEFMCVLAAKEAYALEHQLDLEAISLCRDAQKRFLREHLGRWTPAFARRLARMAAGTPLCALADFTRAFIELECARHEIAPGSEDLLLRPVDAAAESMCNSCGVNQLASPS